MPEKHALPPCHLTLTAMQACALAHALSALEQQRQIAAHHAAQLARIELECAELVAELGLPEGEEIDLGRQIMIDAEKREMRYHPQSRVKKSEIPDDLVG